LVCSTLPYRELVNISKRWVEAGRVAQVVEHLPSNHDTLKLKPQYHQEKKKKLKSQRKVDGCR
jgi:hypothetical protein